MKVNKFQKRFYRDWTKTKRFYPAHFIDRETDLMIFADRKPDNEFIKKKIRHYRWDIENYINKDRRFLNNLKPLEVEINAKPIIKVMSNAAKMANVGPMAAVAGTIAEFLGKDLLKKGHKDVIVENGGDLFLKITKTIKLGIYAGRSKLWNNLRIKIKPKDTPLGICASSGIIGHSLSFGCADCVIILARRPSLADAVATACANRINKKEDLEKALIFAKKIKGIIGVIIILKNNLISWGKIEFIK